jgi:hypothetical protein
MIALIRRALSAALTPPSEPSRDEVTVRSYTRRKPVNAKQEALHAQLRAEMGR